MEMAICALSVVLMLAFLVASFLMGRAVGREEGAAAAHDDFLETLLERAECGDSFNVWSGEEAWNFIPFRCEDDEIPHRDIKTCGYSFAQDKEIAF